jgi:hypothetical protein
MSHDEALTMILMGGPTAPAADPVNTLLLLAVLVALALAAGLLGTGNGHRPTHWDV